MKKTTLCSHVTFGAATVALLAACAGIPEGTWSSNNDMPTGRWELATCSVDGKIYAIGGAGPVHEALATVEEYDPQTGTWKKKSDMPTPRQGLSANVVDGKIYAIGGATSPSSAYGASVTTFSTVEIYDPATDTWTSGADMPTARGFHSANVVGGKIYVFGGSQDWSPNYKHVLVVEVYDPAHDSWTQLSEMPTARGAGFSSVVNGKIYLFGGYGGPQRVDEYNPRDDSWIQKTDMPTARHAHSSSVMNGRVFLVGGYDPFSGYTGLTKVDVYDPRRDVWMTAPNLPTGRFGLRTCVADGKIYAIGGMAYWIDAALGAVEEFSPE